MTQDEALKETAIRLYRNLHSGATENIVSSLLTASLNSSKGFMGWFCTEAGLSDVDRRTQDRFYAEANGCIPRIMKKARKGKNMPSRPDILIARDDEEGDWESVYDEDEATAEEAARLVHAVFVEVKHAFLSEYDKNKYINFLKRLSCFRHGLAAKGKLNKRHKFVVVSSLTKQACDKLERRKQQKGTKSERQWRELIICNRHRVTHLTLERIYGTIHRRQDDWCGDCTILRVFKYYLALHLWVLKDEVFDEYWSNIVDDYKKDVYGLKWEIADAIRRIAETALIRIPGQRHDLDYKRIRQLAGVEFGVADNAYVLRFNYDVGETGRLTIKLPGQEPEEMELQLKSIARQGKAEQIRATLDQVLAFVQNRAS